MTRTTCGLDPDSRNFSRILGKVSADDRAWFKRNRKRTHRLRPLVPGEFPELAIDDLPSGWRICVIVRQAVPGWRFRVAISIKNPPIHDDDVLHQMFDTVMSCRAGTPFWVPVRREAGNA